MKRSSLAVLLCSLLALLDPFVPPAAAQFGFFYNQPSQRRAYRPRRRYVPPKPAVQRPRVPQGKPIPGLAPPPQFPLPQPSLQQAPKPATTQAPAAPEIPLPPERPPALETTPAAPETPPPAPKPIPLPEAIQPVPSAPPATPAAPPLPAKPAFGPPLPPTPPQKPADLPKPPASGVAPSGAKLDDKPRLPEEDATCVSRLQSHQVDVEATTLGPQVDERCVVVHPVRLKGLTLTDGGKIDFPERPTLACVAADTFSIFVRDLLSPLAKGTYGAPVASVWTGPGLECRSRDHIKGAKLSAHGLGLAVDIAQFKMGDGRMFEVGRPKSDADRAFDIAARAAGCGYFHTELGPGSDSFHATHWHFDLEQRGAKGDSKFCQ